MLNLAYRAISLIRRVHADSLYRNSLYLMGGTFVMAIFGFFFWIIAARLYTPTQIGLATTILSVSAVIANFSLFGVNTTIIRFYAKSPKKSELVNTAYTIITIVSLLLGTLYLLGINFFTPKLSFLISNINPMVMAAYAPALLLLTFFILNSINGVAESIFVANRQSQFALYTNSLISAIKLLLPAFLASFQLYGIIASVTIPPAIAALINLTLVIFIFKHIPRFSLHKQIISQTYRFSLGIYLSSFVSSMPSFLLPILITNTLSPEKTAYYYVVTMITNLIYIIPQMTTRSLFAEGSHNAALLLKQTLSAVKLITVLLAAAVLAAVGLGRAVLSVFGYNYAQEGYMLLVLLSLNGFIVGYNYILNTIMTISNRIKHLIVINTIGGLTIIIASYLLRGWGLLGFGTATVIGYATGGLLSSFLLREKLMSFAGQILGSKPGKKHR